MLNAHALGDLTMLNNIELLSEIEQILSDKNNWIKHRAAEDKDGKRVASVDDRACKWCLSGVVTYVVYQHFKDEPSISRGTTMLTRGYDLIELITAAMKDHTDGKFCGMVAEFNDDDETTHQDIMAVIERAKTYDEVINVSTDNTYGVVNVSTN
jgi:hypothetical protein